jgi:hypothetical protein
LAAALGLAGVAFFAAVFLGAAAFFGAAAFLVAVVFFTCSPTSTTEEHRGGGSAVQRTQFFVGVGTNQPHFLQKRLSLNCSVIHSTRGRSGR